ncbi:hypothetical protein PHLCEN_2v10385 [Hermanssonia centrifuga]|uniref:Uncharacterized protein n=1 Tax=Hermanssonia centrifuga TaxID=98765 RepID=A0A2R6NN49_9APHY|nr:hypothetical protein PHLCEN_2v10385 [Hermanssonia centrifuga]
MPSNCGKVLDRVRSLYVATLAYLGIKPIDICELVLFSYETCLARPLEARLDSYNKDSNARVTMKLTEFMTYTRDGDVEGRHKHK